MATNNKKKDDPIAEIKRLLPTIAPWAILAANILAATVALVTHYKKETDEIFMVPFTHVHYMDAEGKYICGDRYIDKKHICDGKFLLVRAEVPTLHEFLQLGLTKEQWEYTQKGFKQFKCEGPNEQSA